MKLPLSLLKSFIELDLSLDQLEETLTLLGIEVDSIQQKHPPFAKIIVGEVLSVSPHPNADKLQVATVSDGTHVHQVVCGAPNCRAHIKTAFAPVGAVLTDAQGQQFSISPATLRGINSAGMLCSASELQIPTDQEGTILELPADWQTGQDLLPLLWDPVLELSLTPNLGHCLSARGIARELSAALNIPLIKQKKLSSLPTKSTHPIQVTVQDPALCPRYMGQMVQNVKVQPSPFWLQNLLKAAGMRPINQIVDITNYIMLKWGQPMHAFDADRLEGASLHISASRQEFLFACLDGCKREVPEGTLVISDDRHPVALAGIMGGEWSAVSDDTKNVFLEAAYFDAMTIRVASKRMNLRSESSMRFEKGTDPNAIAEALNEASYLLTTLAEGTLCESIIDIKQESFPPKKIRCRLHRIHKILGAKISLNEVEEIFHRLGFAITTAEPEVLFVSVPFYRFDLQEEIDLIEEVARIYGYNQIEKTNPLCTTAQIAHDPRFIFERLLRNRLINLGLQEIVTCDLLSPKLAQLAIEMHPPQTDLLKVLHFKSEEYSILRPSLLPGFLQVVQYNLDQKMHSFSGFEIGRIHFKQNEKAIEVPMAAFFLTGKSAPHHWDRKPMDADFYDIKGILENLFEAFCIKNISFKPSKHVSFHPSRQASICAGDVDIGSFGELHPRLLKPLDIKQKVLYAEFSLEQFLALKNSDCAMRPIPQFPSSERDWTVSLPLDAIIQPIFDAITGVNSSLLEKVELIDLFIADKKNATFRFTYRDPFKTILWEEVEKEHSRLLQAVSRNTEEFL
jgi:phenylalanyl-tRNA synthetase beta chain